ncbi:MAG: cell division protein SepF [Defluviitaleaceae bacterium]|nr:cell division protein SepF [Defluviitaleaceae bacterium]
MMGFIDKIKEKFTNNMIAPGSEEAYGDYDGEFYDDDEEYYEDPAPVRVNDRSAAPLSQKKSSSRQQRSYSSKDNVYAMTGTVNVQKPSETIIIQPQSMEDAVVIGSHVRSGRMCIVDLTGVPNAEAQRVADYLCGHCDARDGAITRINNSMITVAPHHHKVQRDFRESGKDVGNGSGVFDTGFFKKASNGGR